MPIMFWNPTLAEEQIINNAVARIEQVGRMFAAEVKKSILRQKIYAEKGRPIYQRGVNAGKYWTARDRMGLLKTVRVTVQGEGRYRNVWIMCGNKKAYYGKIIEFSKPFFRPTIIKNKSRANKILKTGLLGS